MSEGSRLAVVGSTTFDAKGAWWTAEWIIRAAIEHYAPVCIISGGAVGVDSLAKTIAHEWGYNVADGTFVEYLPEHQRWAPDGFEARNLVIATDCTQLLRVSCHKSKTYGSGWTADRAQKLGKFVERVVL